MAAKNPDPILRLQDLNERGAPYRALFLTTGDPSATTEGVVVGILPEWIELQVDDESGELDRTTSLFIRRAEIYSVIIQLH